MCFTPNTNIFGFHIEKRKGIRMGSYGNAIVDLQERVAKLEYRRGVQAQKDDDRAAELSEIGKVLEPGVAGSPEPVPGSDPLYQTLRGE